MSIKNLDELDLKLILQSGKSMAVDGIEIKPFTLKEIVDIGYTSYMKRIQWISLTIDDFLESVEEQDKKSVLMSQKDKLKTLDFYTKLGGQEMVEGLLDSLSILFRTNDIRLLDDGVIALDFESMGILIEDEFGEWIPNEEKLESIDESDLKLIHRDNFDEIIEVIKLQNFIKKTDEIKEEQYADEATRKLMEQMKKNEERVKKIKKNHNNDKEEGIDLFDIINAVSSKSYSINELNIWQLTLYQLYQKYTRLEIIENYDFSVKAIMAGAEKVDLKHWSSKLQSLG